MKYMLPFLASCILYLNSSAQNDYNVFIDDIMVVAKDDTATIIGKDLGIVRFRDKVFTVNCSYYDAIHNVISQAHEAGGNLIKIISVKMPDMWNTCYHITARAYKVDDPLNYEGQIQWSEHRRLRPENFRGMPDDVFAASVGAVTYSSFGYYTNKVTLFRAPRYHIYCHFHCYDSWMKKECINNTEVLRHEQAHFDITEIYARKLMKALVEENLNVYNLQGAKEIYGKLITEWKARQKQYDKETNHGINKDQQEKWYGTISDELKDLADYRHDG